LAKNPIEPRGEKRLSKGKKFSISDAVVEPGSEMRIEIPVSRLVTGSWLYLPVTVLNGANRGPIICVSAALHGDELNGVEIIRRVLGKIRLDKLSGTIVAIPIVNVFGFISQSRYTPDRRDLNRSFPGSVKGSLAARLAHLFLDEVFAKCDYGIDLHTGSNHRTNLPQIRADLDHAETARLAEVFGAPIIISAKTIPGTLRASAKKRGIPMLLYEAGETFRFNEYAIEAGVRGVLNVLGELKMYQQRGVRKSTPVLQSEVTRWVRASQSGVFYESVTLGDRVVSGQTVGVITDTFGDTTRTIKSPLSGIVIGAVTNPLVHQGEALLNIAKC
jgi:predicted deacylase